MKKTFSVIFLSAIIFVAGCTKAPEEILVSSVSIAQTSINLYEGQSEILTAQLFPNNATNKNVTWASDRTDVATVDNYGEVTAVKAGSATITVTTEDGGKTATCKVIVTAHTSGVSINKTELTLDEGQSETLSATVSPDNASNKNVTWASDRTDVATVDNSGKVTALKAGSATITVMTEDGGKTATCTVTVIAHAAGVSLNKTELTLDEGRSETLTATISPARASNKNVTWASDRTDVATVDNNGKVTAVKAGTAAITVMTEDGGKTATCKVTVIAHAAGVSLNKTELTLDEGQSETLTATISPENTSNKNVTWSSDRTDVATVDNNGKVTAVRAGSATVTVKTEDGKKTASCQVSVIARVADVSLNKTSLSLKEGDSEVLLATITPDNANNKKITWSSSDLSVATVDQQGRVIAIKEGNSIITVETEDGGKTASCELTVTPCVKEVVLNKASLTLYAGESETLEASVKPSNAANRNVTWSSSNNSVASVDGNGKVSAKNGGQTTIMVTTEDGLKTAFCLVTVLVHVSEVSISEKSKTVMPGDKFTLTATIKPEDATNKNCRWTSSAPGVATVSENGEVVCISSGKATISVIAEDGEKTADCVVDVTDDITRLVSARYLGGSLSIINGLIRYGSKLNFAVFNNTQSKTIKVKTCQLTDGETLTKTNLLTLDKDVAGGESAGWSLTVGLAGIHSPICTFVYEYNGSEYEISVRYNQF